MREDFISKPDGNTYPPSLFKESDKLLKGFDIAFERSGKKVDTIAGVKAFKLYDTYGFPIDLTALILSEKGMTLNEEDFKTELDKQKNRSRAAAVVETDDWVIIKDDAEEDAEESTEKAAKPMTDEEIALAEEAEAKKPMAPKSDEVTADADNTVDLNQAFSDLVSTVKSLQAEVEMLKSSKVDVEVAKESFEAVAKDIASATNTFNEFGKRVELVEQDTAFRKSGDLGEIVQNQPETVEKSLWGGSFLKTADLFI